MSLPTFLTTAQLADMLQISENMVVKMREQGTGPAPVRIGRNIRYSPASIQRWLDAQHDAPAANKGGPSTKKAPTSNRGTPAAKRGAPRS